MEKGEVCPACGGPRLALKHVLTNPEFHTAKCRDRGLIAMHPYPADAFLDRHYKARDLYNSQADEAAYARMVTDRAALSAAFSTRPADAPRPAPPSISARAPASVSRPRCPLA